MGLLLATPLGGRRRPIVAELALPHKAKSPGSAVRHARWLGRLRDLEVESVLVECLPVGCSARGERRGLGKEGLNAAWPGLCSRTLTSLPRTGADEAGGQCLGRRLCEGRGSPRRRGTGSDRRGPSNAREGSLASFLPDRSRLFWQSRGSLRRHERVWLHVCQTTIRGNPAFAL